MITFPTTIDGLTVASGAVVRAGGTDLQERLRTDNAQPDLIDLTGIADFAAIRPAEDGAGTVIGAGTTLAVVARDLADRYPALALTAAGLATPQIRARATLGGNLVQRTRCWYYRHPGIDCFKSGGDSCPARTGRHLYGVAFDRSACVHPHPSSMAMVLLTYNAEVILADGSRRSIGEVLGDGRDPARDHALPDSAVIASIELRPPWAGEQGAYFRAISRFEAEWPLVECAVRARFEGERVAECGIGLGGVATVPLRMTEAEARLMGQPLSDEVIEAVAEVCIEGADPLPETGYKVDLIAATVQETLERLRRTVPSG